MTENQKYALIPKKVPGEISGRWSRNFKALEPSQMNAEFSKLELDGPSLPKADALGSTIDADAEMIAKALNFEIDRRQRRLR